MTGKHTPGPWEMIFPADGLWPPRVFAGSKFMGMINNSDDAQEQRIADAHLIAAAPDLLELVELIAAIPVGDDMADDVPIFGLNGAYITCGNVRAARAAIAKARGQE